MKRLLFEDLTQHYNRWVSGIASREMENGPVLTTMSQILGTNEDEDQTKLFVNKQLPFPLTDIHKDFSQLYISLNNILEKLTASLNYPLVSKNIFILRTVKKAIKHLILIGRILRLTIKLFSKLVDSL